MEAIILAAGLGTRLRPLTDDKPKALVEVGGRTLLEIAIERVYAAGAEHIAVNVHHHADMMIDYIKSRRWPCPVVISDERAKLLDTGGGILYASTILDHHHDVLVHNVDVMEKLDLRDLVRRHRVDENMATLCVSERPSKRLLAFDAEGRLVKRTTADTVPEGCRALAFSGVAMLTPAFIRQMSHCSMVFSIIDEYIRLSFEGNRIMAYEHDPSLWMDVGTLDNLKKADKWIHSSKKQHGAS